MQKKNDEPSTLNIVFSFEDMGNKIQYFYIFKYRINAKSNIERYISLEASVQCNFVIDRKMIKVTCDKSWKMLSQC